MKKLKNKKLLFISIILCPFLISVIISSSFIIAFSYQNKFYPNTKIAGINIGNKDKTETIKILDEKNNQFINNAKINIRFRNQERILAAPEIGLIFDSQRTVDATFRDTHQNIIKSSLQVLSSLFNYSNFGQITNFDSEKVNLVVSELAKENIIEPRDAKLEIVNDNIIFSEAKYGLEPDYLSIRSALRQKLSSLEEGTIDIQMVETPPGINDLDLAQAYFKISLLLQNKGFELKKGNLTYYSVTAKELKSWLKFEKKSYLSFEDIGGYKGRVAGVSISAKDKTGVFVLPQIIRQNELLEASIDENKINEFIATLAGNINRTAKDAQLGFSNGQITVLKKEIYGAELDKIKLLEEINMRLNSSSESDIELPVNTTVPDIRSDNLNSLGIKEVIAVGESNFTGSPKNRIHNLTLGSSKFNGAIIKPGTTASFASIVGSVEASDGYLPELVIKGTKTIQEYGGGMCQVSTTFYRAALQAGFPIVERRSHAYLVGYYKDGPDATVYVPSTDLKFKNDTDFYILVQTRIEGKKLIFEFWSTKSGRQVNISAPQYVNIVPAPSEPYYVDDPTYPTGYEKMEEKPHEGATGLIYRTITYPDGKVKKEEIKSVYKPWPAKIRRGTGPVDLTIPSPTP